VAPCSYSSGHAKNPISIGRAGRFLIKKHVL
jgi:hypothetical protein